jgi:transposase
MHYREGASQRDIQKRTGVDRKTILFIANRKEPQKLLRHGLIL